ncbi:tyrosine-type recombinase/integrase [Paenibacillus donghaensis]|uniref:tyrosine-type recombinase/integrase n=1 Tax=Paenibacillus donghaensis TaxID=414771 RepID=UPI001D15EB79|nr:tyrosine-type recombinase/integrase [Paenibacillus donghaensis]
MTWSRLLASNKLPHVKLHGLRYTAGMLLRESGADLKTIQERLRHTKLDTTANIYTHKSEAISRAAADQLKELNPKSIKFAPAGENRQPFVENRQKKKPLWAKGFKDFS